MGQKVALVLGASGLVGSNLIKHLTTLSTWRVLGASRSKAVEGLDYKHVSFDLMKAAQCKDALRKYPDITHVFIAARLKDAGFETMEKNNVTLIRNLLDAVEEAAPSLQHVHVVQGNKWYGSSSGPTRSDIPAREDDPRQMPPNPYYSQHDYLLHRQAGRRWSWSAIRPGAILGFAPAYPNNLVTLVGAYAAISRELNLPLRFPGTETCFNLALVGVDVEILCKAIVWISEHEACRNQAFNVTNGDPARWRQTWPVLADALGVACAEPKTIPLADMMPQQQPVWDRIAHRHGLRPVDICRIVDWRWMDYMLRQSHDIVLATGKIRRAGFHDCIETDATLVQRLRELQASEVLPP